MGTQILPIIGGGGGCPDSANPWRRRRPNFACKNQKATPPSIVFWMVPKFASLTCLPFQWHLFQLQPLDSHPQFITKLSILSTIWQQVWYLRPLVYKPGVQFHLPRQNSHALAIYPLCVYIPLFFEIMFVDRWVGSLKLYPTYYIL